MVIRGLSRRGGSSSFGSASRGEIVRIADEDGHFGHPASGDPESPIAVRGFARAHQFDAQLFRERLEQARDSPETLRRRPTTAYRILNGEGDRRASSSTAGRRRRCSGRDGDAARWRINFSPRWSSHYATLVSPHLVARQKGEGATIHARFVPLREKVRVTEHGNRSWWILRARRPACFLDQ